MRVANQGLDGRYSRQVRFAGIGEAGQARLAASRVVVVGCGALGCALVNLLARSGVGTIVVVDRAFVELSNIQRQLLFEESDAAERLPKAVAAARAVARINSEVKVEPIVADVRPENVLDLVRGADVVLDGTDNLETRYLVNDACVRLGIPWVYGGAVGAGGMSMTLRPGEGPCFRCVFAGGPTAGLATCDTAGVLGSIIATVASIQWTEATKLLVGAREQLNRGLVIVDLWSHEYQHVERLERNPECPCCGERRFEYLEARATSQTTSLCGRNAVQVAPAAGRKLNLADLRRRLAGIGKVGGNDYLVRFEVESSELTIFPDGRAIVKGTSDPTIARALYARYVGS